MLINRLLPIKTSIFAALLFAFSWHSLAQKIKGKIISDGASSEYVEVRNTTLDEITFSDNLGEFEIKARIKDTLVLKSVFFEETKTVVDSAAIQNGLYIELKERHFDLAEVVITTTPFEFDLDNFNYEFKLMLQEDIKRHPFLYNKPPSYFANGIDFLAVGSAVFKGIAGLFKKNKAPEIPAITFEDLESLFVNNSFFTEELLQNELKIGPEEKYRFFDYCEARYLNASLLKSKNRFLLLDELVAASKEFRQYYKE